MLIPDKAIPIRKNPAGGGFRRRGLPFVRFSARRILRRLSRLRAGEELGDAGDDGLLEGGDGHDQHEDVADGHADPQQGGGLEALVHVLAPDQQQHEEAADGRGDGGGDIGDQDQLGGGAVIAVADGR